MARLDTPAAELRDRALTLTKELEVDQGTWYVRVLEEWVLLRGEELVLEPEQWRHPVWVRTVESPRQANEFL